MPFTFLEHTTDVRMRIDADSRESLFRDALLGMADVLQASTDDDSQRVERRISVESPDLTALLVDFLNEALRLMHTHKETYTNVRFLELTDNALAAIAEGLPVRSFAEDIKAVTWHEADIVRGDDGRLSTNIIFDI